MEKQIYVENNFMSSNKLEFFGFFLYKNRFIIYFQYMYIDFRAFKFSFSSDGFFFLLYTNTLCLYVLWKVLQCALCRADTRYFNGK